MSKDTVLVKLDSTLQETLPATHFIRLIRGAVLRDVAVVEMGFKKSLD